MLRRCPGDRWYQALWMKPGLALKLEPRSSRVPVCPVQGQSTHRHFSPKLHDGMSSGVSPLCPCPLIRDHGSPCYSINDTIEHGSHSGAILSPRRFSAVSRNISGCHNYRRKEFPLASSGQTSGMLINTLQRHRTAPLQQRTTQSKMSIHCPT